MILAHHIFETTRGDHAKLANFGGDIITKLNNHAYSIGEPGHKVFEITHPLLSKNMFLIIR